MIKTEVNYSAQVIYLFVMIVKALIRKDVYVLSYDIETVGNLNVPALEHRISLNLRQGAFEESCMSVDEKTNSKRISVLTDLIEKMRQKG